MAENKTKATEASVASYLGGIEKDSRRKDCEALVQLMSRATKTKPKMWGPAIVGFGTHHYCTANGKPGEICAVGFASRKSEIALYGLTSFPGAEDLLSQLGPQNTGKGCLYLRHLREVNAKVLERLVAGAFAARDGAASLGDEG